MHMPDSIHGDWPTQFHDRLRLGKHPRWRPSWWRRMLKRLGLGTVKFKGQPLFYDAGGGHYYPLPVLWNSTIVRIPTKLIRDSWWRRLLRWLWR